MFLSRQHLYLVMFIIIIIIYLYNRLPSSLIYSMLFYCMIAVSICVCGLSYLANIITCIYKTSAMECAVVMTSVVLRRVRNRPRIIIIINILQHYCMEVDAYSCISFP